MDSLQQIRERLEEKRFVQEMAEIEKILQEGFTESLKQLSNRVPFQCASVYGFQRANGKLKKLADFGGGVNFIERIRFDHGYGLSAWVAQKQAPIYLPDIHRGSRHGFRPIRSYLSMPILLHDELVGVVNFAHVEPNAFERPNLLLIKSFIDNIKPIFQIYERIQQTYGNRNEPPDFARRR